ncbi:MAG TPA: TetR/AcrR family transcriptional regulator [Amycolatopsis sp.]|nr:TetR/AcrR family transcriptional regulator [Amycolatopsis sp.]
MPTGVHLRDARRQLLDAAERVLLRDGPSGLTSRAVTAEADVSKGVLHRHFADFDGFLAELVHERISRIYDQAGVLCRTAGTGTVAGNLARALVDLLDPVLVAIVGLVIFRDELRARLRQTSQAQGLPVLAEVTAMIAAYLTEECELGRIAADADVDSLALALTATAHLMFAGQDTGTPKADGIHTVVETVLADVIQRRLL